MIFLRMYLNIRNLIDRDRLHLIAAAETLPAVQAIRAAIHKLRDDLIRERDSLLDDVTEHSRDKVFVTSIRIDALGVLDSLITEAKQTEA